MIIKVQLHRKGIFSSLVEIDDSSEQDSIEDQESKEDQELCQILEQRKLQRKKSKNQQLNVKRRLIPPDPLKGFGQIPLGFRLSTLAKNYHSGNLLANFNYMI